MAETKLTKNQLHEVATLKKHFGLSLGQCCFWLERHRGVYISRTRLYQRFEKLDFNNLPVHVSDVLQSIGIGGASR